MRLRAERPQGRAQGLLRAGLGVLGLAAVVTGPGLARDVSPVLPATGPAADYPVVLGAPFTIDGVTYTPADTMNYDQVGYAVIDDAAGAGVTIAHRTLPLPSYAEVTSLRTGKTIVVRVERRGPMTGAALVALSPGAASQLGSAEARTPIRIRRGNPPEPERALLRAGQRAPDRMDTPMSLVAVLMRKLEAGTVPAAPLATGGSANPAAVAGPAAAPAGRPSPAPAAVHADLPAAVLPSSPKRPAVMPPVLKPVSPGPSDAKPAKVPPPAVAAKGALIQVGAFASKDNAAKAAAQTGGAVSPAGKLFRVRITGLSSPEAARAALAKVKAAGYSDARILPAD